MNHDLQRRVALVTGATDGIGELTAKRLAANGATVLVHGRSGEKVERVVAQIRAEDGEAAGVVADLASLDAVRALASDVLQRTARLDVLINNAGVGDPRGPRRESEDGHELHFAVNVLAPVLLTQLLAERLCETAQKAGEARVVMVSSVAQTAVDFDDPQLTRAYDGMRAYAQSKLALIMAAVALSKTLAPHKVIVNAQHPGTLLNTKMARDGFGRVMGPAEDGAEAQLWLATAPELSGVTGAYFDRMHRAAPEAQAEDPEARRRLMALIAELTAES
jgi:NAD(P)-dependent dehydrogenase (short-subunit alcohol dehydrogenase family)